MLKKIKNDNEFIIGNLLAYNSLFKTWSIEHYSKCSFRCAYCCCDSQGNSVPTISPDNLIKTLVDDMNKIVSTGLFSPHKTKIILSCHTDPYIDIEQELLLTRKIIRHLVDIDQPFSIVTRGILIQRDLDILKNYQEKCDISFSLPIIDPAYIKKFEPHTPPIEKRIEAIWAAYNAGINITIRIDPWIPDVTDVEEILACLPDGIDVLVSPLMLSEVFKATDGAAETYQLTPDAVHQENSLLFNKYLSFAKHGFCRTATKLFSDLSQADINNRYVKERNRIGLRHRVRWFYPPSPGWTTNGNAYRFLKPNELSSSN